MLLVGNSLYAQQQRAVSTSGIAVQPALIGDNPDPTQSGGFAFQMLSWPFLPISLNFTSTPISYGILPNNPNDNSLVAAAYDEGNQLLFYATYGTGNATVLRDGAGNIFGSLPSYTSATQTCTVNGITRAVAYSRWGAEMAVVPVPGVCRQFYLIYTQTTGAIVLGPGSSCGGQAVLLKAVIDCSGVTPFISVPATPIDEPLAGPNLGIAVSKEQNGQRFLYLANQQDIKSYTISAAGIGAAVSYGIADFAIQPMEIDLSPDGTKLGLTSVTGNLTPLLLAEVNTATGAVSNLQKRSASGSGYTYGVEFSADSKKAYYTFSNGSQSGIYQLTLATNQIQKLINSELYASSMLELAHDAQIYAVSSASPNRLAAINTSSNNITLAPPAATVQAAPNGATPGPGGVRYALPDQIDGQDYRYFFGLPSAAVTAVKINNGTTYPTNFQNYYTCQPLLLDATLSNATSVRITLVRVDRNRQPYGNYQYSTAWAAGNSLATVDLRNIDAGYLLTNPGYYLVQVEARNTCGNIARQTAFICIANEALPAPTELYSGKEGTPLPAGTLANPSEVGGLGGAVIIPSENGGYDSYRVSLEVYNPTSGDFELLGESPDVYPSPTNAERIPLNTIALVTITPAIFDYFAQPSSLNRIFRIKLTLQNGCGQSQTMVSYFTPVSDQYRTVGTSPGIAATLYPNPVADGSTRIHYTLSEPQRVTIRILDQLTGKEKMRLLDNAKQPAGTNELRFATDTLPTGSYIYQIIPNKDKAQTGRLLKSE